MKKAYPDYKKYYQEEGYNEFKIKAFGLRLWNVVNKLSATKNNLIVSFI
jgi:hypothetical protein